MLTYRNTPTPLDNRSRLKSYSAVVNREKAIMERQAKEVEAFLPHTKKMPPLKVGNIVRIQNQTGNAPRRWDKSGQVWTSSRTPAKRPECTGVAELPFAAVNSYGCTSHTRRIRAHAASLMISLTGLLTLGGCHHPYSQRRI